MGFEFILARTVLTTIAASYYTGLSNLIEQDILYTHNSTSYTAQGLSRGDMISLGISLKYPVSQLWDKK